MHQRFYSLFFQRVNFHSRIWLARRRIRNFTCPTLIFIRSNHTAEEWVCNACLPASEHSYHSIVQHSSWDGRCVRVICAFSSSPSSSDATKRGGDTVSSVRRTRVSEEDEVVAFSAGVRAPRRFLIQTGRTIGGPAPPRPLWQLDEVHIDPVQVSPTSTSPTVLFMFCREADSACLPLLWWSSEVYHMIISPILHKD